MAHAVTSTHRKRDTDTLFTLSRETMDEVTHPMTPPASPSLRAAPASASSSVCSTQICYTTITCPRCKKEGIAPIDYYNEHIHKKCYTECAVKGCNWKCAPNALNVHMESVHPGGGLSSIGQPMFADETLQVKYCTLQKQLETVQNELCQMKAALAQHHPALSPNIGHEPSKPLLVDNTNATVQQRAIASRPLNVIPDDAHEHQKPSPQQDITCTTPVVNVEQREEKVRKVLRKRKASTNVTSDGAGSHKSARCNSLRSRSALKISTRTQKTTDALSDLVAAAELIDAGAQSPHAWLTDVDHNKSPSNFHHVSHDATEASAAATGVLYSSNPEEVLTSWLCTEEIPQREQPVQALNKNMPQLEIVCAGSIPHAASSKGMAAANTCLSVADAQKDTPTASGDTTDEDELIASRSTLPRSPYHASCDIAPVERVQDAYVTSMLPPPAPMLKARRPKFTPEEQATIARAFYIFEAWKCYPDPVTGSNDESSKAATKHVWSHIVRYYFPQYARDSNFSKSLRNHCRRFVSTVRGPRDAAATEEYERIMASLNIPSSSSLSEKNVKKPPSSFAASSSGSMQQAFSNNASTTSFGTSSSLPSSSSMYATPSRDPPSMTTAFTLGKSAKRVDGACVLGSLLNLRNSSTASSFASSSFASAFPAFASSSSPASSSTSSPASSSSSSLLNMQFASSALSSPFLSTPPLYLLPTYPSRTNNSSHVFTRQQAIPSQVTYGSSALLAHQSAAMTPTNQHVYWVH
jgi:hypothetical protein